MGVIVRAFAEFGVAIGVHEARGPMGMAKRDHIAAAWEDAHGRSPTEADIDAVCAVFAPMNVAVVTEHADMIDGAVETVAALRARGLKIGSTTG